MGSTLLSPSQYRTYPTNAYIILLKIIANTTNVTVCHTLVACLLCITFSRTVWSILPPSIGPIGTRLNKPTPKFNKNSQ